MVYSEHSGGVKSYCVDFDTQADVNPVVDLEKLKILETHLFFNSGQFCSAYGIANIVLSHYLDAS